MHRPLLILSLTFLCLGSQVALSDTVLEAKAIRFVELLSQEEFASAYERFSPTMKQALPVKKLRAAWEAQQKKMGAFQKSAGTRSERLGDYHGIYVTCQFEKQQLEVNVVYDTDGLISGLFFLPGAPSGYKVPAYVRPDTFQTVEVEIGEEGWALPGTLTIPIGEGPFPAVVLVHGSGPQDRDETIGPNKPFRDLAEGLSSNGILVLRYDKRTKTHSRKFQHLNSFTVMDETVEDAQAAVHFLKKRQDVRQTRLFVLGHSLGGMVLPRIAEGVPDTTGFIFLAAPARPLEDLMLEQTQYQASLLPDLASKTIALMQLTTLQQQVESIKALKPSGPQEEKFLLGAPAPYWLDLASHPLMKGVQKMENRMLFLQGEKDCQVSYEHDYGALKEALDKQRHTSFLSYPTLNHLFINVEGKSTGKEYLRPGNVCADVVNDIVQWMHTTEEPYQMSPAK